MQWLWVGWRMQILPISSFRWCGAFPFPHPACSSAEVFHSYKLLPEFSSSEKIKTFVLSRTDNGSMRGCGNVRSGSSREDICFALDGSFWSVLPFPKCATFWQLAQSLQDKGALETLMSGNFPHKTSMITCLEWMKPQTVEITEWHWKNQCAVDSGQAN